MIRIRRSGITGFCAMMLLASILSMALFTHGGVCDGVPAAVSIWCVGIGSAIILIMVKKKVADGAQQVIIYSSYLIRVLCMLVDLYGREYVTLMYSGSDSESFFKEGQALYYKIEDAYIGTKYPYVLNAISHITGMNRTCLQYANIVFWVLSCFILIRLCRHFEVKESLRRWLYILWGFLPTGFLLTSILLRESMEMFFGLWSMEHFIYWMENGNKQHLAQAFIYVLPSVILHSASVALWAAYIVIAMFWDVGRHRWHWQLKSVFVCVSAMGGFFFILATPLQSILFAYLGNDFSMYTITHRPFVPGGSDYLTGMDCQSWVQFVPYTIIRMFYFLFSPLPTEARGMGDILMFLVDGFVLFFVIVFMVWKMWKLRECRAYIWASLLGGIMFAGIFAWGVSNAGTALRHRYLVWGTLIAGLCISCSGKKEGNHL